MKTLIRFPNKQPLPSEQRVGGMSAFLPQRFKCRRKTGAARRWSVGPTYPFTSFGQGVPQELLQFDLFLLGWGEARPLTRTPASTSNATMERGKDQPQSSSGHVPFLSLLVKAATNYRKGAWAELPCSADLCDTETGRHGAKLKANLQSI